MRNPKAEIVYWPLEDMMVLTRDRVLFNNLVAFEPADVAPGGWEKLVRRKTMFDRLCGAHFGGSVDAVQRFSKAYQALFERMAKEGASNFG